MEEPQAFENRTNLDSVKAKIEQLKEGISKTIVGQNELIEQLIICLLADGHAGAQPRRAAMQRSGCAQENSPSAAAGPDRAMVGATSFP